jgi:PilZ domain-containing protein
MESHEKRTAQGRERRAHPRANCDGTITIQLADGAHQARLRDVSRAGICFFLDRPLAEMTMLAVRIDLPARERQAPVRIDGRGVVVRCQPIAKALEHYEIAVFLNELAEPQRDRLDAFVAASTPA